MSTFTAKRLPVQQGPAAWNAILPAADPYPSPDGNLTADFVIVGAGFAGLSAARRLTKLQPRASIVVLDAGRIAEAASGRNSGFMIDLPHDLSSDDYAGSGVEADKAMIALNRKAIAFAAGAVEDYGIDRNYFDRAGKVNGAVSAAAQDHNRTYAEHLARLGESYELLDQAQMHELSGSRHYTSGLYTPGTVMLQPAGYVRGLARGLSRQGVHIFENSPVTGFESSGVGWQVKTPRGVVSTGKLIIAVNGHLESFGFVRGRLMQLFLYASMTEELDAEAVRKLGGKPRWGITPSDPMGTTMRRIDTAQGGNRIVTRTCATLKLGMNPTSADVARASAVHRRKFEQRFPQLSGMKQKYQWAGHLCLSLNSVAVMREIERNVFAACVQNGLGLTRGTLTGIGAAELACCESSDITRHFTAEAEPKPLPPQPFATIGANAWLRWKEWLAREE